VSTVTRFHHGAQDTKAKSAGIRLGTLRTTVDPKWMWQI
jgi:hypothetical protein